MTDADYKYDTPNGYHFLGITLAIIGFVAFLMVVDYVNSYDPRVANFARTLRDVLFPFTELQASGEPLRFVQGDCSINERRTVGLIFVTCSGLALSSAALALVSRLRHGPNHYDWPTAVSGIVMALPIVHLANERNLIRAAFCLF